MISAEKGRIFYIETEPYIVFHNEYGEAITRKVKRMNKAEKKCIVRFKNKDIELNFYKAGE